MSRRNNNQSSKHAPRWARRLGLAVGLIVIVLVLGGLLARHQYYNDLKPADPLGKSRSVQVVAGSSGDQIAEQLASQGIIKSKWAFEIYLTRADARNQLKAGTYELSPAMDVSEIVSILSHGRVASHLVTILPGQRLDQVRQTLLDAGFKKGDVDKALDPTTYAGNPALVDKPKSASLEGFLYPDSFAKATNTLPQHIIEESLNEMAKQLTPDLRAAFAKQGLSVYEGITLASIVDQEAATPNDRAQVAQVFLSRREKGITLGSDVTAFYGAHIAGKTGLSPLAQLKLDTPYNTLIHKGLPPGPISNVDESALQAVAHPAHTDWLFFVAGDDGKVYFSHTAMEHEAQIQAHCHKLCNVD